MMTTLGSKEGGPIIDHGRKRSRNGTHAIMAAIAVAVAAVTSGCTTVTDTLGKRENAAKTGISPEKRQQAEVLLQQALEKYKADPLLYTQIQSLGKRLEYLCSTDFPIDAKLAGLEPEAIQEQLFGGLMKTLENPEEELPTEIIRKQLFTEMTLCRDALIHQYTQEFQKHKEGKVKEEMPNTKKLRELIDRAHNIGFALLRNNVDLEKTKKDIDALREEANVVIARSKTNTFVRSAK